MFTVQFHKCKVIVWPSQQRLVTIFEDGTEVPACPNYDEESHARARALGYGDDIWLMTLEHELMHSLYAESREWPYSASLWKAAHPKDPWPEFAKDTSWKKEEAEVFRLQAAHRKMQLVYAENEQWIKPHSP